MPNTLLLCQDEEEEEGCNSMLTIQEDKLETKESADSPLGCRVRTVWRRWHSLWLKRKYTSKEPTKKPFSGFWRWLTLRHLLLQAGSGHPHLAASDHLHMCQSLQPCFMCSPLMLRNRCFLDDGERVMAPHWDREAGRPFLETRLSPVELLASDTSQKVREVENNRDEDKAPGSCNMFRALRRHTAPELRLHFEEESDSDLQELLVEDEDDADGAADTD
ncbi:hypothetical protein ABVT39_007886 [Epinephelus coioides]